MARFRCGYSVRWNFNGIIEVEADSLDESVKRAEAELDRRADGGEFDDVSGFRAEFDDVVVLDSEEVEDDAKRGDERFFANRIAGFSAEASEFDGETAAKTVAEAVVLCEAHPVVCEGDRRVSFSYCNEYGPTCTVGDVLERMSLRDWRMACDEFCRLTLRKGGLDPESFDWPTPVPHVTKIPESDGTDVTASVRVTFRVDQKTYEALVDCVDRRHGLPDDPDADGMPDDRGEETCCKCDVQIEYKVKKGKTIVTCPECGAINPLCSECSRPEREKCACGECELSRKCNELNKLRAETAPERISDAE